MKGLPPLGDRNDGQRRCSRITGRTDTGGEILCDAAGAQHVIWWWREAKPGENLDDCWDHGFCCPEHWAELAGRWSFAAAHTLTAACGMPGSRCHFEENTCTFDGLDVVEPERTLAVGIRVPA